jgi:pSer/pThr/pTyr-binding forkhead associated (FHA) protein
VVLDDKSVSRYHARIEWVESQPHVTDLGSANGTLVNEAIIIPDVPQGLKPGDNIQIVDFELTLHEPPTIEAERRDVSAQPM